MTIRAIVLGAAAGGGLPQWNCAAPNSNALWSGTADFSAATQSSLAVSGDGTNWAVLNASPDIGAQIRATKPLQPIQAADTGLRRSPIRDVLVTNADIDHIAGLLTLRERQPYRLIATDTVHDVLDANPIFDALAPDVVTRVRMGLGDDVAIQSGLTISVFAVPGKVPLFLETAEAPVETDLLGGQSIGLHITDGHRRLTYIPGCSAVTDAVIEACQASDVLMFDGTVYRDTEMIDEGVGEKTGRRMGHVPIAGSAGSLSAFADSSIPRRIYTHINNTNPIWRSTSDARKAVEAAGWQVAFDGMEIVL